MGNVGLLEKAAKLVTREAPAADKAADPLFRVLPDAGKLHPAGTTGHDLLMKEFNTRGAGYANPMTGSRHAKLFDSQLTAEAAKPGNEARFTTFRRWAEEARMRGITPETHPAATRADLQYLMTLENKK